MTTFPEYLDLDYTAGESQTAADYPSLVDKMAKAVPMRGPDPKLARIKDLRIPPPRRRLSE